MAARSKPRVGLAEFATSRAAAPAVRSTGGNGARRKRGQGDVVALTVRLSHAQWDRMHTLARQEGISLQELAIEAIAEKFATRGLDF